MPQRAWPPVSRAACSASFISLPLSTMTGAGVCWAILARRRGLLMPACAERVDATTARVSAARRRSWVGAVVMAPASPKTRFPIIRAPTRPGLGISARGFPSQIREDPGQRRGKPAAARDFSKMGVVPADIRRPFVNAPVAGPNLAEEQEVEHTEPMIRALYAEDDPNVAGIVRSYIEHFAPDWQLEIVPNGMECLNRMAIGGYDILLLDLVLPDTDGLHILGELARRNDTTPVVMVTGHGQTELAVRALRAGAADCVDKTSPQFLQLVDIVKRVQARHAEGRRRPATAPVGGHHPVMLIEGSSAVAGDIRAFFAAHAPQFDLSVAATAAETDNFFAAGAPAHAIVIGPNPPNTKPLEVLRRVHSHATQVPALIVSSRSDGETAVAAFKLGAQDFILQKPDYITELVFSLNSVLRQTETERQNALLAKELETLNRSLEAQVIQRTSELQALSLRLLRIQEDERRAIARELHDEIGQLLTGLKLQLESAQKAAGDAPLRTPVAEAYATASSLLEHVRILTQQYRPRVLDDLGLQPALEWHAKLFTKQTGIEVALDVSLPPGRLPGELETVAYRIIQEALTNAARHAQAKLVSVTAATTEDKKLIVEISDRGRGFDVTKALARTDSLGLAGLRERVNLAGGRIEIYSRPGEGTRISVEFPVHSGDTQHPFPA
ncbi:MAG: hypothetical protein C0502_09835 [Opitutus sp.]|nr:hypothetical protein [Opitutus sp.]